MFRVAANTPDTLWLEFLPAGNSAGHMADFATFLRVDLNIGQRPQDCHHIMGTMRINFDELWGGFSQFSNNP